MLTGFARDEEKWYQRRVGDGFAARQIPWGQAVSATFKNGRLSVNLGDIAAPTATISLPSWPPKDLAA